MTVSFSSVQVTWSCCGDRQGAVTGVGWEAEPCRVPLSPKCGTEHDVPIPCAGTVLGGMGLCVLEASCPLVCWPEPKELWGWGNPPSEHTGSIQH